MAKRKTKSSQSKALGLKDIWPQERDFMQWPERFMYVRKLVKPKGCVFCNAAQSEVSFETLVLFKGPHTMVMLNKYPYNNGHLLILPRRHCGDLTALKPKEYEDLSQELRRVVDILKKAYGCAGLNLGMNHGEVAGAGIPSHLHWHAIPRWLGDTNFFPLIAETKVHAETLEQTYDRLLPFFRKAARKR